MSNRTPTPADRVLAGARFIEAHLGERFTLAEVAAAAGVSPYHFSRLFQAATGTPVMGYARARRLTEAARRLAAGERIRLIELALDSGFDSQEAFTRAFKARFGVSPGVARKTGRDWSPRYRRPLDAKALRHMNEGMSMEPRIIERGDVLMVGLRREFEQDDPPGGPELWRALRPHIEGIPHKVPGVSLGAIEMLDRTTGRYAYSAGVEVGEFGATDPALARITLEGGRFAVFTHTCRTPDIGGELRQTLRAIYGGWAEKNRDRLRAWYELEYYDERFDPATLSGEIDIYVPVR